MIAFWCKQVVHKRRKGKNDSSQGEKMREKDYKSVREKGLQAFRNRQRESKDFVSVRIIQVLNKKHHQEEQRGAAKQMERGTMNSMSEIYEEYKIQALMTGQHLFSSALCLATSGTDCIIALMIFAIAV